jgi:hypothetical protein
MVVGSRKTMSATQARSPCALGSVLGLCMVDAREIRLSPPKQRRALRAYRRFRLCPPPPLGCGRSPPYLPAGGGVRLAHPGSLLAGVTFTPAQPPLLVNSPGEKTNLTQKEPAYLPRRADGRARARRGGF